MEARSLRKRASTFDGIDTGFQVLRKVIAKHLGKKTHHLNEIL
jgi:hypothetical protein